MRTLHSSNGFSLIEVMVSSAVLACAVLLVAQQTAASIGSTARAREVGEAALLAWQKVDQLRALAFTIDDGGGPVTDVAADSAAAPERRSGGTGLAPSPAGTLSHDTAGYVDYLDALGEPLGGGDAPPPGARYRRRWAVSLADGNPDLLALRVRVVAVAGEAELAGAATLRARRRP
jgi:prepilin-type N-terminal cleavage/methylation domain-containing protein